jgi:membrane-anchored protein YejM (alkaline phosphatase superfamily)
LEPAASSPAAWSNAAFASSLLFSGGGPVSVQWDAHDNIKSNHEQMCRWTDKPIAGLLKDLKSRGLLDSTLVIWGSEFGRTPVSENGKGRDHNPTAFTMWMAGGGVKGGQVLGETDELGFRTVGERYHPRDIHATMLHLLGIDQMKLTYLHNGRNERLTDFGGTVIDKVFT